MPLVRMVGLVTRAQAKASPQARYVFGDNMERWGRGGLAKELRYEPNAIGIPTKWKPTMDDASFFKDADLRNTEVVMAIADGFLAMEKALVEGRVVYYPALGIGTGLADLPRRAPAIHAWIEAVIAELERRHG